MEFGTLVLSLFMWSFESGFPRVVFAAHPLDQMFDFLRKG